MVVPFVHEDLKAERLLQAVAVHFFTRILRGELIVEVVGAELGSVTLNKVTIAAACKGIKWDGPKRTKRHVTPPIDFVATACNCRPLRNTPFGKAACADTSTSRRSTRSNSMNYGIDILPGI